MKLKRKKEIFLDELLQIQKKSKRLYESWLIIPRDAGHAGTDDRRTERRYQEKRCQAFDKGLY